MTNKGNKATGDAGQKRHLEEPESFFAWFNDHLEGQADEVGELIKDDIWPNPLQFYLVIIFNLIHLVLSKGRSTSADDVYSTVMRLAVVIRYRKLYKRKNCRIIQ